MSPVGYRIVDRVRITIKQKMYFKHLADMTLQLTKVVNNKLQNFPWYLGKFHLKTITMDIKFILKVLPGKKNQAHASGEKKNTSNSLYPSVGSSRLLKLKAQLLTWIKHNFKNFLDKIPF